MRRKKKFKRRVKKVLQMLLPIIVLLGVPSMLAFGYFNFFDSNLKAEYYFNKAQELDNATQYGSRDAVKYYNKAITIYENIGNRADAVNAYINLGLLHYKFGNIVQVERMVLRAIEVGGKDIPKPLKAQVYMLLASTVEPIKAKEYIKSASTIADELGLKILSIKSNFILAKIYEYNADFENAKKTYLKAIQIYDSMQPEEGAFDPEPVFANLGELYSGEGNAEGAITYYEKALQENEKNTEHGITAANYMKILGDLYKDHQQITKACENWNKSKEEYILLGKQPPMSLLQLSISEGCRQQIGSIILQSTFTLLKG